MAAISPNLSNFQAPASVGGISLPTQNTPVAPTATAPANSTLNLSQGAGLPSTGITNQNVLPSYLRTTTPPVSPVTGSAVGQFGSSANQSTYTPPAVDQNYFVQPGESPSAYQARIASYDAGNNGTTPTSLANGSIASVDSTGAITSPAQFNIDMSGAVDSDALTNPISSGDVSNTQNAYQQNVQGLATASQYSPDYITALQAQQNAQLQGQQIQSNFYTGNPNLGDTVDYATGETAKALQQNTLQQTAATNALNVQTLLRQGNIAAATALVQATAPTSVAPGASLVSPYDGSQTYSGLGGYQAVQGIQTVNSLAQNYPDAGILPTDDLPTAESKAAASQKYASEQTVQLSLPGGGISFVNKNQLVPGANGETSIISAAQGTAADAASTAINNLTTQKASIGAAINTVDNNFPLLTNVVQQYGLNTSIPLANQLQQKLSSTLGQTSITQLNALATGLKATIAQIVSRGGQVDDKTRSEADALLPTNVSYSVLEDLENVVQEEGAGVLSGMQSEIDQQNATLNGIYSTATPISQLGSTGSTSTAASGTPDYNF